MMTDPIEVLGNFWRDENLPISQRVQAAIAVLPFEAARLIPEPACVEFSAEAKWAHVQGWMQAWLSQCTAEECEVLEPALDRMRRRCFGELPPKGWDDN